MTGAQGLSRAEFGEVYAVEVEQGGAQRAVVVLVPEERGDVGELQLVVAPLSPEVGFASEGDLVVPQEASPLGYPFMVEVWNQIVVLRRSLGERICVLPAGLQDALRRAWLSLPLEEGPVTLVMDADLPENVRQVAEFRKRELEAFDRLSRPLMEAASRLEEETEPQAVPGLPSLPVLLGTLHVATAAVRDSVWGAVDAAIHDAPASRLVRYLASGLGTPGGERGWVRPLLGDLLNRISGQVQSWLQAGREVLALAGFTPVPAGVGAFAEVPRERLRVDVAPEGGRLKVTVWETDEGDVRVDVHTPAAEDHGRTVRVVLLGEEGNSLAAEVRLELFEFQGRPYGSVGGRVLGPLGELREQLGGEWAVVAAFVEEVEQGQ